MSIPEVALGATDPFDESSEDKELVLAFKRGEDGSYQAIYGRYSPRVRGICRRLLVNDQDAEEAQQETFMKVFTGLAQFNGRYHLGAWVGKIATNVCLDHLRSKDRRPVDSADQSTLMDLSDSSSEGAEDTFMKGDERQRVREVIAGLAPMHRAALALREFEGMSYADIAVALGMSEPQVKALLHRARKSFKKHWGHGLAIFLPWRLIARIRRFSNHYDAPPHLADAAASTANIASSCSAALQQCGTFVADKAAGAFTALIVGTAAVAAAVGPNSQPARAEPTPARPVITSAAHEKEEPPHQGGSKSSRKAAVKDVEAAVPDDAGNEAEPDTAPTPPPSEPTSEAPAEESPQEKPPTSGDSTATTGPAAIGTAFGWESEQPTPRYQSTTYSTSLECAAQRLTHSIDTLISDGAFSYRTIFRFEVSSSSARLEFTVFKDGREWRYSAWGAQPVVTWSPDGLEIAGDYGLLFGQKAEDAKLPGSGHFDAALTLDCAAQTVVTEGATFTAE